MSRTRDLSKNTDLGTAGEGFKNLFWRCLIGSIQGEIIPIDGKTLGGSYERSQGQSALHLVTGWASHHDLALGQAQVEDHANEITAIPALLELLDITGSIITIDAMGTQEKIVQQICRQKADYILPLKGNHPT